MAAASLVLPFLPLLPKQILLTNVLTDIPETAIAGDATDPEMTARPRRWDIRFIRAFMLTFGLLSSGFDILTFVVLRRLLRADAGLFRTGWFVESVISAALIVLVVRTRGPFWKSRPSRALAAGTLAVAAVTAVLPLLPFAGALGFVPLPARFYGFLAVIVASYIAGAEALKRVFYRRRPF
jgi:Mg2+-importing ATPase